MDPYAGQFWAYTQKKELRLQKCSDCGKFRWPPGPTCDKCLSDNVEWAPVAGRGKVLSWTTFRRKYFDEYPAPHTVIVLELDEGPLFVSYPVDVDVSDLREHGAHAALDGRSGQVRRIQPAGVWAGGVVPQPSASVRDAALVGRDAPGPLTRGAGPSTLRHW